MNIWHEISPDRITPDNFCAVIEIPKGCKTKYELDKETGFLMMDRILYTSTHYPANYGFIPRTYAQDDDPLDVLVLCSADLVPLSLVPCYPIGVIIMEDCGKQDEKIIAVPFNDPIYNTYTDISQLPQHVFVEMAHFFSIYKSLEGKETTLDNTQDAHIAKQIIGECIDRYRNKFHNDGTISADMEDEQSACSCRKTRCERHGNCAACKKFHHAKESLTHCEKSALHKERRQRKRVTE